MKQSLILLHGLFGGLSNWNEVHNHFCHKFDVHIPLLPISDKHEKDELEYLVHFLTEYIKKAQLKQVVLIGNSLGGHVAIMYTNRNLNNVKAIVLTGSSGLYEKNTFGNFPKRHNYSYIKKQVTNTFYNPKIATKELVDEVFDTVTDNHKCLQIIKTSRRAQNSYVTDILPKLRIPVLLVWGENDIVSPPSVAEEFHQLLPNATLVYFSECGHAPMMEKPLQFNETLDHFFVVHNIY